MSNHVLRICLWILGTISLVGNSVVIFWRLRDSRDSKVSAALDYFIYLLQRGARLVKLLID